MKKSLLFSAVAVLGISSLNAQSVDAALTELDVPRYVSEKGSPKITGTVTNYGTDELTDFDIEWTDGTETYTHSVSTSLATGESEKFEHPDEILSVPVGYSANITVTVIVDGDEDETNNSDEDLVEGILFVPKKRVFGEEATGLWCGWCPRGMVGMEYMEEEYGDDWIGVAVHNGDIMANDDYDDWMGDQISGYPSGLVDRKSDINPAASVLEQAFEVQIEDYAKADIYLYPMLMEDDEVLVRAEVNFAREDNGDYRIAILLAEDGLSGSGSSWAQANYYSGGGSGQLSGAGKDWHNEPSYVTGLTFNDVARQPVTDVEGEELKGSITPGVPLVFEADEFTWDSEYDMDNTRVIALLIDDDNDRVVNAVEAHLMESEIVEENGQTYYVIEGDTFQLWDDEFLVPTGVSAPKSLDVKVYPNPAHGVVNVALTEEAEVTVMDMMGKVVARANFTGNGQGVQFNAYNFSAGIYNIIIKTETETVTERVSVVK